MKAILTKKKLHELKSFNMFKLFNLMNSVSFPLLDGWRLATFTFWQVCCFIKEHVCFNAFIKKLCKKNCEKMLNNKFDFFVFIIYIYEICFSCRKKLVIFLSYLLSFGDFWQFSFHYLKLHYLERFRMFHLSYSFPALKRCLHILFENRNWNWKKWLQ